MSQPALPEAQPSRKWWSVWHVLAVFVAFAVCAAVFRYTGDSDVFLAIGSGAGTGLLAWLLAHLHVNRR